MNIKNSPKLYAIVIIVLSFGLLLLLSSIRWGNIFGVGIKDFNLFSDLIPVEQQSQSSTTDLVNTIVDKDLAELLTKADSINIASDSIIQTNDSIADSTSVIKFQQPDSIIPNSIENYTSGEMLAKFKSALSQSSNRLVRVAVIGDSYIEGDIFCQDLRNLLQQRYGGSGVGYMAMHSDIPGFRHSVTQSGNGWAMHDIRTFSKKDTVQVLSGSYGKASSKAWAKYKGTPKFETSKDWSRSSFIFIAPDSGMVTFKVANDSLITKTVTASSDIQCVTFFDKTTSIQINNNIPGLIGLGVYLDAPTGVAVDCMSVRGNSGLALNRLNYKLSKQLAKWIDYDLIIVEYGMNVLSAEQRDYTSYMNAMINGIKRLKSCYPNADILIMGVGDRGVKNGTTVTSLSTVNAMVKAQRELAQRTGCFFYDTRLAMGGEGCIVDWRKRKLVNADYIHINHSGGEELANIFNNALISAIEQ